jgi:hypothetical protein
MSTRSQKHCRACSELLSSSSGRYLFTHLPNADGSLSTLHFILINSRWARVPFRSRL